MEPIYVSRFAGQNWAITPVADISGRQSDRSRHQFQITLSGVVIVDLQGNSASEWLRRTIRFKPDIAAPLDHAITRWALPSPGTARQFIREFGLEQWVPHAAPASTFNKGQSINSGFAVDVWRPTPFGTPIADEQTGDQVGNLFAGIDVDVAVRDTDAILHRVAYHITLVGRIVFRKLIIR
jgi:hypothetical protein